MTGPSTPHWLADAAIGVFVGGVIGVIFAVNLVIYAGPDQGYESSITDVFEHNIITGFLATGSLIVGPIVGVAIARHQRKRRSL